MLQKLCRWHNGQPLGYRRFARAQLATTWSITKSFQSNWEVQPFEHVESSYHFKEGLYDNKNPPNLTRHVQKILNASLISESLCVTISTGILTIGTWNYIYCDEPIQMPYVVCEKTRSDILLARKTKRYVLRASYECNYRQVLYFINKKFRCVSLKKNCLASALMDITLENNENYGITKYLWKWTMSLTFTIGYIRINSTHGLCLDKLQKCCYHEYSEWKKGNLCLLKQTPYWWCATNTKTISQQCSSREFQCLNGVCILNHYRCDNIIDCLDASDEKECNNICTSTTDCFIDCKSPECSCSYNYIKYGNRCEALYWRYDELMSISNLHMSRVEKTQQHIFNGNLSCPREWALCASGDTGSCYPNEKLCVFERNIFGTPLYCSNTEHLEQCYDHQCPTHFKCKAFCIPIYMLCDGVSDCPDEEDEAQTLCMLIMLSKCCKLS